MTVQGNYPFVILFFKLIFNAVLMSFWNIRWDNFYPPWIRIRIKNEGSGSGSIWTIKVVWRKKPRQTVVVVLWGKIATHMASLRLCCRQVDKRRAGSKMRGGICILHFLLYIKCFAAFWQILQSYCRVCPVCVHTHTLYTRVTHFLGFQFFHN